MDSLAVGRRIHDLARELFPICRSITGDGVRRTLAILRRELPGLRLEEVASGTKCFDWEVPPEWNVREAYILGPDGAKVVDFRDSNLHVVGYSEPVDAELTLEELEPHLHSRPDLPDAIPYVTSYYQRRWGFCLPHRRRAALRPGRYRARIDSTLQPGSLTYGELILPGESADEVFISTYVCHPSMGNNELSGPTVTTFLAQWLAAQPRRRYSYRIVFAPETIGAIVYISRNLEVLRKRVKAAFNVTCVGDERAWSYLPTPWGDTLADRTALHVLRHFAGEFRRYGFLDRGSDERQYCSPGVELPMVSVMRSKYHAYPEYHTSADDLELITPAGLGGAYEALRLCLVCLEGNLRRRATSPCEPQLGRRRLYPTIGGPRADAEAMRILNVLAYCDGRRDLLAVAEAIGEPLWRLFEIVERLSTEGLLEEMSGERS